MRSTCEGAQVRRRAGLSVGMCLWVCVVFVCWVESDLVISSCCSLGGAGYVSEWKTERGGVGLWWRGASQQVLPKSAIGRPGALGDEVLCI